jgi:hypothetical protein
MLPIALCPLYQYFRGDDLTIIHQAHKLAQCINSIVSVMIAQNPVFMNILNGIYFMTLFLQDRQILIIPLSARNPTVTCQLLRKPFCLIGKNAGYAGGARASAPWESACSTRCFLPRRQSHLNVPIISITSLLLPLLFTVSLLPPSLANCLHCD